MSKPEGKTEAGAVRCAGNAIGHDGIVVNQPHVDYAAYTVVPHEIVVCRRCGLVLKK
jgi:hypothetical protein